MITSSDVHTHHNRRYRLRFAQYHMEMTISNILRDKSFVDDLNKEQGIVSMRVGSALRSTEIKPLFPDLWRTQRHVCVCIHALFSPTQITREARCTGAYIRVFALLFYLAGGVFVCL